MFEKKKNKKSGYLLVEILISLFIFSVLVLVVSVFLKRVVLIEKAKKNNQKMYENMYNKENMIISWTTSLGLIMWVIFLIFGYTIYKKEYRYILAFTPIILLWLTCIASPVSGDLRYIYASYTTLPIYLLLPILIRNNNQMLEVEEVEKEEK